MSRTAAEKSAARRRWAERRHGYRDVISKQSANAEEWEALAREYPHSSVERRELFNIAQGARAVVTQARDLLHLRRVRKAVPR